MKISVRKLKQASADLADAVPKVAKAVTNTVRTGGATPEQVAQRKKACATCPLFTGTSCNHKLYAASNGKTISVEDINNFVKGDNKYLVRQFEYKQETYTRGCGCPLSGTFPKWAWYFDKKDLSKKDGTGPCPMGKWN